MNDQATEEPSQPACAASRDEGANSTVGLEGTRRVAVLGAGRSSAVIAALMALSLPMVQVGQRKEVDGWGDGRKPINTGRRAEKDAAALAKAEAKRQRKAAKRMKMLPSNEAVKKHVFQTHNGIVASCADRVW